MYCGTVVSEDLIHGAKCAYLTKLRDKYPVIQTLCESLKWNEVETGNLITIDTLTENNLIRDYIINLADGSTSTYYPFIGIRKTCTDCSWYWEEAHPVTYTNWYGSEPNTWYYECGSMRFAPPYDGKWIDMTCSGTYHGVCQFYMNGTPKPDPPVLPPKAGCKSGWWSYGGYCYKDFGYKANADDSSLNRDDFQSYPIANNSCNADWDGAQMAILPTIQHNSMIASLLGPFYFGSDVWIGVYNWAYYDYYFR